MMIGMKRIIFAIVAFAAITLTSCYSELYDWEAKPETEAVNIPKEGGIYVFDGFEYTKVGTTRGSEPNKVYKCYRYRLNFGEEKGEIYHNNAPRLEFVVPANQSGSLRTVVLEVSKALDFHITYNSPTGSCSSADLIEECWGEWQSVWRGLQDGE